jgi:alpha-L-fucosidase
MSRILSVFCAVLTAWGVSAQGSHFAILPPGIPQDTIISRAGFITPTPRQIAWQELEFTCFIHFGMNTFMDREWGEKNVDPSHFEPTSLDARQWVRTAKSAGARLLVLVAKHHDGFCLWPTNETEYSVKRSPWKEGKGDVVAEVSVACREEGVKFGVYLSPWDISSPLYGTDAYNEHFLRQLRELLTWYGQVSEVWFDGACGEGPNGKRQVYDWPRYYALIRRLQPDAVIAVMGPDVRWVGTESGYGRATEWSVVPASAEMVKMIGTSLTEEGGPTFFPSESLYRADVGSRERLRGAGGLVWYPSEVDVSIRPGWFYHEKEDSLVKSPEQLVDIYYSSVGRNSVLLLNLPPDRRGLIHENDVAALRRMRAILDSTFAKNLVRGAMIRLPPGGSGAAPMLVDGDGRTAWRAPAGLRTPTIELGLGEVRRFDRLLIQEDFRSGQKVEAFCLEVPGGRGWKEVARGTTIGYKRLLRFPPVEASRIRLRILAARGEPGLAEVGLYLSAGEQASREWTE